MKSTGIRITTGRVKLADHIPLDQPMSVTLVPSSYCNFSCGFCPASKMRDKAIMDFSTARSILGIAGFPKPVKVLHLYNVGEPLLNPDLAVIVRQARKIKFAERISMVTNARILHPATSRDLISSGVDRINISLYGLNDADYLENTNRYVDFGMIYQNIKYLNSIKENCYVFVKVLESVVSTPERQEQFKRLFEGNCSGYAAEPILPIWPNFNPTGEAVPDRGLYEGVPAKDRLVCHYPFYSMVVNARGFVNPCLADWDETEELGDAKVTPLKDIWDGWDYQNFRRTQLMGWRPMHPLCKTCGTLKVATAPEDDLEDDRERLLDKLRMREGVCE